MDEILSDKKIEYFVTDFKIIPAGGGKFEVTVNDELVFSKKQLKRHAEVGEVHDIVWEKLQPLIPDGFEFHEDDD